MTPEQSDLLTRSLQLLAVTLAGGALAAYFFRKMFNLVLIIGTFIGAIVLIFVMNGLADSGNVPLIYIGMFAFGAFVSADVGGFFLALGMINKLDPEEITEGIYTTLAVTFGTTFVAAMIGLFAGVNFQFLQSWLFIGLFALIGISLASIVGWISRKVHLIVAGVACVFWAVYMIFDFNKLVNLYTENTWPNAVHVTMSIYLDMVNFLIRFAEIYFAAKRH